MKMAGRSLLSILVLASLLLSSVDAFGVACKQAHDALLPNHPALMRRDAQSEQAAVTKKSTKKFKLALTADTSLGSDTKAVYNLIKQEGADAVIIAGDLDYQDAPSKFIKQLDSVLPNTPAIIAIGNHDLAKWSSSSNGYASAIAARYKRLGMEKYCTGDVGVKSVCKIGGITVVASGVGTRGSGHEAFIDSALGAADPADWKICTWHKNQATMQPGDKSDEVGWGAYKACLDHGAFVMTGHCHAYARSHLLSSFQNQAVISTGGTLALRPGQSAVAVVGLGGRDLYGGGASSDAPWWAKTVTADTDDQAFGAMFCTFNPDGASPQTAKCETKTIDGKVLDSFTMTTGGDSNIKPKNADAVPSPSDQAIAKRETTQPKCTAHHIEAATFSVPTSQDAGSGRIDLNRASATFAFDLALPAVPKGASVILDQAYLQVYGASEVYNPHDVKLRVSVNAPTASPPAGAAAAAAAGSTVWQLDGEAERHEVWNSPNLAEHVKASVAAAVGAGQQSVKVALTVAPEQVAKHGDVAVYGVSPDACVNPSLVMVVRVCE
ncbi:hypothetical protein BC828DRAFT_84597 [Blastocladiella britannica]|nr:hypothetical protein BC828DRAFT_84597 [Blastocladiella britannica]